MSDEPGGRTYGMGRGKVFPAKDAKSLLNPLRRLVQSPAKTVAAMGLSPTDAVLEVGAGPGFFSPHLASAVPSGRLVVLDLQLEMLAMAKPRLSDHGHVALLQGDAVELPIADGALDAVLIATVLGEVPDLRRCLGEVRRVLRPAGTLSIAETRRDSDFIGVADLRSLLEAHSFSFVDRQGPRWQYVARFRRS